jgi:hypothetical protein
MKNALKTGILALMILLALSSSVIAQGKSGSNEIQVKINYFMEWGEISQYNLEFENREKPRIEEGRVLVPLRKISDSLGFAVSFDHKTKRIDLTDDYGKKIVMTLNSKKALVNNTIADVDVPAKVVNQITFVPLRFISENFDQKIVWDPAPRTVIIDNFIISTPEYLFNKKTLELSKRDKSGKGQHLVLDKIDMSVDWVGMQVTKTGNGNDVIVINNNTGAPHLFYDIYTIYVSEKEIVDQSKVHALFSGKPVFSADGDQVVIGDGKTARVYDDRTKKILDNYDLLSLFKGEMDPNPSGAWENSYVVLGLGDNYILVKDTFKMLTKLVYLDTKEIVHIYQELLSDEEQEKALIDAGPFGSGDRLRFIEESGGKLIFDKYYDEGSYAKTKQVAYPIVSREQIHSCAGSPVVLP